MPEPKNKLLKQKLPRSLSGLTSTFPGEPGLASFVDDESGGDNRSYNTCKAAVKSSPSTNQLPTFLQAGCPSCRPSNSVKAVEVQYY